MDKLEALASVARLSSQVVRILGQNPGKFTLQGTNTYLIGTQKPYILVDTGEGRDDYIPHLEHALGPSYSSSTDANLADISDIIISHWHHDHVGGIPSVLKLLQRLWSERNTSQPRAAYVPPKCHKFPLAPGSNDRAKETIDKVTASLSPESYTPSPNGLFHDLIDGQTLSSADKTVLNVIHTPGHTTDSISVFVPSDEALYTADTVLGQGTAVFEDLGTYIASLRKMHNFKPPGSSGYTKLYPGHGPVVTDGHALIETYIKHRLAREEEIVKLLESAANADDETLHWTTWSLVSKIYAAYPESLWLPAAHGVDLHLKKLLSEGRVSRVGEEAFGMDGVNNKWQLT